MIEDTAVHFRVEIEEERKRRAAISELEAMIELLGRKTDAFNRRARVCELSFVLGLPPHLYKALEAILYDPRVDVRRKASRLISIWAKEGR